MRRLIIILAITAGIAASASEKPLADPLANVLERTSNIFLVTVTSLEKDGYAKAGVDTVIKGHYENEIWIVRRMPNGDLYPFTPGRRYVIFCERVLGGTYQPAYDVSLYAVRIVDFDDRIEVSPFPDFAENESVDLGEFVSYCREYLDPLGTF